jgi:hypothetical protein
MEVTGPVGGCVEKAVVAVEGPVAARWERLLCRYVLDTLVEGAWGRSL